MVTLKQLQTAVNVYLKYRSDKQITSIGTYNGASSRIGFELFLCDIYVGPIGQNPFTGKDSIQLYNDEDEENSLDINSPDIHPEDLPDKSITARDVINAIYELVDDLNKDEHKSPHSKMQILKTSLDLVYRLGLIDEDKKKDIWMECSKTLFDLE